VAALLPRLVRPAGRISLVGVYGAPVALDLQALVFREVTMIGNRVYTPADIDVAIEFLATPDGASLRSLVTAVVPLDRTASAFERLAAGDGIKILVDCAAS
jgi:threonine dehydrogenase-like Zn-dependent dehydrogenase